MSDRGVTPGEALGRLNGHSVELGALSAARLKVSQALDLVSPEYQSFVDDFEIGLLLQVQEDGGRLPSEALRQKQARHAMPPELLGRYDALVRQGDRINRRIADIKVMVDADRSILSALKTEMEASR